MDGTAADSHPPAVAAQAINPTELRMNLEFLASPELGGRYTLSPNFGIAARFLATRLEAYGFKGLGDNGSFFQSFDLVKAKIDPASSLSLGPKSGVPKQFAYGDFFSRTITSAKVTGDVVFIGYGISSKKMGRDDYAGLDVKGKIVLFASGAPKNIDDSLLADDEHEEGAAFAHGAIAALALPSPRYVQYMKSERFRQILMNRQAVEVAKTLDRYPGPVVVVGLDIADTLLAPTGLTLEKLVSDPGTDLKPQALGMSATIDITSHQETQKTQNVVGMLEGTDARWKNSYVALSAHYDHLKTNAKGQIYPGADDDGSGTVAVLDLAKAFSKARPKRSILVIFHAGEELGLLGSEYNADYGHAVPLSQMDVDLNIDMIGRSRKPGDTAKDDEHLTDANTIYLVGADRISSELDRISEKANSDSERFKLDYYYNDVKNPERIYYRSDHWNYAKHDVPIIFYFDGTSVDYHQPTDTVDKIDFDKLSRVTHLVFETAWRIANLDHDLRKDAPKAAH